MLDLFVMAQSLLNLVSWLKLVTVRVLCQMSFD